MTFLYDTSRQHQQKKEKNSEKNHNTLQLLWKIHYKLLCLYCEDTDPLHHSAEPFITQTRHHLNNNTLSRILWPAITLPEDRWKTCTYSQ